MADIRSSARADINPRADADPASDMIAVEAPVAVGYFVAFLMTALATIVAVGVDSRVNIPNLSLVFVVPVITAAVVFGFGPRPHLWHPDSKASVPDDGRRAEERRQAPISRRRARCL